MSLKGKVELFYSTHNYVLHSGQRSHKEVYSSWDDYGRASSLGRAPPVCYASDLNRGRNATQSKN